VGGPPKRGGRCHHGNRQTARRRATTVETARPAFHLLPLALLADPRLLPGGRPDRRHEATKKLGFEDIILKRTNTPSTSGLLIGTQPRVVAPGWACPVRSPLTDTHALQVALRVLGRLLVEEGHTARP
jgi:hypothetical protein